jgi:hypothetical protein
VTRTANGRFVTTYRCNGCWRQALDETRTRLEASDDDAEIASAADVFERHGIVIHEHRRGDPAPVVRHILIRLIGMLASGLVQLSIGAVAS